MTIKKILPKILRKLSIPARFILIVRLLSHICRDDLKVYIKQRKAIIKSI